MTIGAVAKAAGVKPSAIRYYEAVGIMPKPPLRRGIRQYAPDAIDDLQAIRLYRASGMSIGMLARISAQSAGTAGRRDAWRDAVEQQIRKSRAAIRETQRNIRMLERFLACDCRGRRERCVVYAAARVVSRAPSGPSIEGAFCGRRRRGPAIVAPPPKVEPPRCR